MHRHFDTRPPHNAELHRIELIEGLHLRQMSQLQPGLQVTLLSRVGFRAHDFEQEIAVRRFLFEALSSNVSSRASIAVRLRPASVVLSRSTVVVIARLPPDFHRQPKDGAPPSEHSAEYE